MRIAIMQPYFLPYIGYFQLINAVDFFVVYDDIKYTKKGWFNRNRILYNGKDSMFTVPIKKGSDSLYVRDRYLANNHISEVKRILRKIELYYSKAPYYDKVIDMIKDCFLYKNDNLFNYIYNSIQIISSFLNIDTKILISSNVGNTTLCKGGDRVVKLCKLLNANIYINSIGGVDLYSKDYFRKYGLTIFFLKPKSIQYRQYKNIFVPNLSIVDVLMFNPIDKIHNMLLEYELV